MRTPKEIAEIRNKALPIMRGYLAEAPSYGAACGLAWEALDNAGTGEESEAEETAQVELATMVYYLLAVEEIGK